MRATFTEASTLGIAMGDTNMLCDKVEDALRYGDIGSARDVDYHPGPVFLESFQANVDAGRPGSSFVAHPMPAHCTDFIFAGDADVDPVKPLPLLVGLDGEHVAIAAKVVFNGPPGHVISSLPPGASSVASTPAIGNASTPAYHHGVTQRDIDAAKEILGRKTAEDAWVPHERARGDEDMANLLRKQTKDKMMIELLHVLERDDQIRHVHAGIRSLADKYEGGARALRSELREHSERCCASTPAETDPMHVMHAWELIAIGQLHAEQKRPIQEQQAYDMGQAALDRTMAELTAARRAAKEKEKARVVEVDDSSSSSSSSGSSFEPLYSRSPIRSSYDESDASTLGSARSHHDDQQGQQQDQNPQQQQQQQQAAAAASSSSSRSCRRSSRR